MAINKLIIENSSGNVGIGTTNPSRKLEVNGNISLSSNTNYLLIGADLTIHPYLQGDASGQKLYIGVLNAPKITIDGNGNIGINTTTPTNTYGPTLHIRGSNPNLRLDGDGEGSWAWISLNTSNASESRAMGVASDGSFRITNVRDSLDSNVQFTILQNGKVGINTGTPSGDFQIFGNNSTVLSSTTFWHFNFAGIDISNVNSAANTVAGLVFSAGASREAIAAIGGIQESSVAESLAFFTGGNGSVPERMRIDSTGRLLINTTTPPTSGSFTNTTVSIKQVIDGTSGGGLHIESSTNTNVAFFGFTGNAFRIGTSYRSTGGYQPIEFVMSGINVVRITNDASVGVGTTNPQTKLFVHSTSKNGGEIAAFTTNTSGGADTSRISFWRNYTIQSTDPFRAAYISNINYDDSQSSSNRQGLSFWTKSGTSEPVERFRVTGDGNVGIGLTTPRNVLTVYGTGINASFGYPIGVGSIAGIHFGYSEAVYDNDLYRKSALVFERTDSYTGQGGNAGGKIHFLLNNAGSGSATDLSHSSMTIDSNANGDAGTARVGIATRSPEATLDVNGNIFARATAPLSFLSNSNTGIWNRTVLYVNQNNTSGSNENGFFLERGRVTDTIDGEIRNFIIGSRGGQVQFILNKDGNVGIGAISPGSTAVTRLDVDGGIRQGYSLQGSTGRKVVLGWYNYYVTSLPTTYYTHFKTNMWGGGSPNGNIDYTMSLFEATGYDYSAATIKSFLGFHNWSGSIYSLAVQNIGTKSFWHGAYVSSDGYVVLVANTTNASYLGVSIDWYQVYGYPFVDRRVTAVAESTSATGVY